MPSSDYSARDYDTYLARLKELIQKWFTDADGNPLWTDFDKMTVENTLVKAIAWYGDQQTFNRDRTACELFIRRVIRRENLLGMADMFGFTPNTPSPGGIAVRFSLASAITENLTVEAGTALPGIPSHYVDSDVTITAGNTYADGTASQIEKRSESAASVAKASAEYLLSNKSYVGGSMVMTTAAGAWSQVDDFLASDADDLHYRVLVDQDYRPTVKVGDGINGALPEGTIGFVYETTRGTAGAVSIGTIKGTMTVLDDGDTPRTVSYTNTTASSGASDGDSTAYLKNYLPEWIRTSNALVTRTDYEAAAKGVSGIVAAFLLTQDDYSGGNPNEGTLYCVASGTALSGYTTSAAPTATQVAAVQAVVDAGRLVTFRITAAAAPFRSVDVEVKANFDEDEEEDDVAADIYLNLRKYFAVLNPDGSTGGATFGIDYPRDDSNPLYGLLRWSDILNVVRDTDGVEHIPPDMGNLLLNDLHEDAKIYLWQFPQLGDVHITNLRTGEEWDF